MIPKFSRLNRIWLNHITLSDNQLGLSLLALIAGTLAGLVITGFRLIIEYPILDHAITDMETGWSLSDPIIRSVCLIIGVLILISVFSRITPEKRSLGVVHVLQRMKHHQGYLPFSNLLLQWFAAIVALGSGHSGGREGPAVHMGAATASLLGQHTGLAHHRLRILTGCGVASAISASFNTPMAGVIFAMEVVLLEYSMRSFVPVILASVIGSVITRIVFGDTTVFTVPTSGMHSLWEIPYLLFFGLCGGLIAVILLVTIKHLQRLNRLPLSLRWGSLTLITILWTWNYPQLMAIGYDSVNMALTGQLLLSTVVILLVGKLLLTAWAAAVSFPVGIIGPTLFIGAMLGYLMGVASHFWLPEYPISVGFYAMLGMGVMMGAVLRAPLAGLVALLELTANPSIIMPGMLTIVVANLVVSEIFKYPSIFAIQMGSLKDPLLPNPVEQILQNTWIAEVLDKDVTVTSSNISLKTANHILAKSPSWLFIPEHKVLIKPATIAQYITSVQTTDIEEDLPIQLMEIPARREFTATIHLRDNLQDALEQMRESQLEYLAVVKSARDQRVQGVISRKAIEEYYQYKPNVTQGNT